MAENQENDVQEEVVETTNVEQDLVDQQEVETNVEAEVTAPKNEVLEDGTVKLDLSSVEDKAPTSDTNEIKQPVLEQETVEEQQVEEQEPVLQEITEEEVVEKTPLTEEEKEYKSKRKLVQEKLIKFATRIPAFMYLTDFRENTLQDVITKLLKAMKIIP